MQARKRFNATSVLALLHHPGVCDGCRENRVLDGPASGEKGSKGRNSLRGKGLQEWKSDQGCRARGEDRISSGRVFMIPRKALSGGISKSIFQTPCQLLAISAHKMAPITT